MSTRDITVDELQELLRRNAPVRILDVRDEDARREWRIPGSEHLPWPPGSGEAGEAEEEPLDPDRFDDGTGGPVVVVCDRGRSSQGVAASIREDFGVDARSLEGGMAAWSFAWNVARVSEPGEGTGEGVGERPEGGADVLQLRRTGKGCLSYLVASGGEALVLDPSLDAGIYLDEAERRGWTLRGVVETHLHADHVSRGRRLAEEAGVPLHLPRQDRARFAHRPLDDGDHVPVGRTRLTALHTPGHTGESHSYLLDDRYLFTGDTLFLNAVGRPDLEARGDEEEVARHARLLHRALTRLAEVGHGRLVLPAHTAEPVAFDGEPVAAPFSVVRDRVEEMALEEEELVARLLRETPPTPANYERIVELNEAGDYPADALLELEAGANRCAAN